ncbi:hypothetical protein ACGF5M_00380 [Gemmatimonadota bacterium]
MPSEDHVLGALRAVKDARDEFHSAVVRAVEEVRGILSSHGGSGDDGMSRLATELGQFGADTIDPSRFATMLATSDDVNPEIRARIEKAYEILVDLEGRGDDLFRVAVDSGENLRDAVAGGLARAGRAFGAARTVDTAMRGQENPGFTGASAEGFPVKLWNRAEHRIAPPLVVEVSGEDLAVGGLSEFLDGGQKIVLVVDGPAPPAALVRLITPGVMVVQTDDPAELQALDGVEGPAIAALLPEGAARFVHDPSKGSSLAARLQVDSVPEEEPTRPIGRLTAFQQAEELRHLRDLVPATGAEKEAAEPVVPATPPDRLAAFLLHQADLSGL